MSFFSRKMRAYCNFVQRANTLVGFNQKFGPAFTKLSRSRSDIQIKDEIGNAGQMHQQGKANDVSINGPNKLSDVDVGHIDKRDIHIQSIRNHNKYGSIYQEEIGPDVKVVYIADPTYCAQIFRKGTSFFSQECVIH